MSLQTKIALLHDTTNCNEYFATFQVPIGGKYMLKIFRIRSEYHAIREDDKFPSIQYNEIFNEILPDNLERYTPEPCTDSIRGYWVSENDRLQSKPIKIKQECSGTSGKVLSYRGLPLTSNIILDDHFPGDHCGRNIDKYLWNRKICLGGYNADKDQGGEDLMEAIDRRDNRFQGQKILFVGDSHMRGLVQQFMYSVCGWHPDDTLDSHPEAKIKNKDGWDQETSIHIDGKMDEYFTRKFRRSDDKEFRKTCNKQDKGCKLFSDNCDELTVTLIMTMYCDREVVKYFKSYEYIVMNWYSNELNLNSFIFLVNICLITFP